MRCRRAGGRPHPCVVGAAACKEGGTRGAAEGKVDDCGRGVGPAVGGGDALVPCQAREGEEFSTYAWAS